MKKFIIFSMASLALLWSCDEIDDKYMYDDDIVARDWNAVADSSSMTLAQDYWNATGHFFNNSANGEARYNDYWPEAHGLDVLVDAYLRTKDDANRKNDADLYKQRIYDWYEGVRIKNWYSNTWENEYYDDMGWHGLAHLRALEATGDTRYEASAKALWGWITEGWTDYQGGGIKWRKSSDERGEDKGVPSNGPAAIIAARRWVKYGDTETYGGLNNLEWAKRIYDWMKDYRFVPTTGRVFERFDDTQGDWTYNSGTFLGAALELYHITGEEVYLKDAIKAADYAVANLSNNGVLSDWAQQEDHDVNLFKGVFIRYFTQLMMEENLPDFARLRYVTFMKTNGETLWTSGAIKASGSVFFGSNWREKPTYEVKLRGELSGCMLMEAMALLQNKGYIK